MLSSIVSKGYIFLLVKVIYRVTGAEVFAGSEIINVLLYSGSSAWCWGPWMRCGEEPAEDGCLFLRGTDWLYFHGHRPGDCGGDFSRAYHIFAHAAAKSLVFVAAFGLIKVSAGNADIQGFVGPGSAIRWRGRASWPARCPWWVSRGSAGLSAS